MISDLTSPITLGSEPRYEVMKNAHNAGNHPNHNSTEFQWRVVSETGELIHEKKSKDRSIRIPAKALGGMVVSVTILKNGVPVGEPLEMSQQVVEPWDVQGNIGPVPFILPHSDRFELVNNLKDYVIDAAAATGPKGISARFLAGVMFAEIGARPKEGREEELATVENPIRDMVHGRLRMPWEFTNRSLGVGQVRMSTAAMVEGHTPWVDISKGFHGVGVHASNSNFNLLDSETKAELFELLRWPKTNIQIAAKLLAKLKNRPHRYPEMTKGELGADDHALGVLATEYNMGGTDTPRHEAQPSEEYGKFVTDRMKFDFMKEHFSNE